MKTYMILSSGNDGYTENNAGHNSECLQVLDVRKAETADDARDAFIKECKPFKRVEYHPDTYTGDKADGKDMPWTGFTVVEVEPESTWLHVIGPINEEDEGEDG